VRACVRACVRARVVLPLAFPPNPVMSLFVQGLSHQLALKASVNHARLPISEVCCMVFNPDSIFGVSPSHPLFPNGAVFLQYIDLASRHVLTVNHGMALPRISLALSALICSLPLLPIIRLDWKKSEVVSTSCSTAQRSSPTLFPIISCPPFLPVSSFPDFLPFLPSFPISSVMDHR